MGMIPCYLPTSLAFLVEQCFFHHDHLLYPVNHSQTLSRDSYAGFHRSRHYAHVGRDLHDLLDLGFHDHVRHVVVIVL